MSVWVLTNSSKQNASTSFTLPTTEFTVVLKTVDLAVWIQTQTITFLLSLLSCTKEKYWFLVKRAYVLLINCLNCSIRSRNILNLALGNQLQLDLRLMEIFMLVEMKEIFIGLRKSRRQNCDKVKKKVKQFSLLIFYFNLLLFFNCFLFLCLMGSWQKRNQ